MKNCRESLSAKVGMLKIVFLFLHFIIGFDLANPLVQGQHWQEMSNSWLAYNGQCMHPHLQKVGIVVSPLDGIHSTLSLLGPISS